MSCYHSSHCSFTLYDSENEHTAAKCETEDVNVSQHVKEGSTNSGKPHILLCVGFSFCFFVLLSCLV